MAVTFIRRRRYEPRYDYAPQAVCDLEGMFPLIDWQHVDGMIDSSTPVTHDLGNRRYKDYVFLVDGSSVKGVGYFNVGVWGSESSGTCPACKGTGKVRVYDVCGACDGDGCERCEDGLVESQITCQEPDCSTVKKVVPAKKVWDRDRQPSRRSQRVGACSNW